MTKRDEPVDLIISFLEGKDALETQVDGGAMGQSQKPVTRKDLEEVADLYEHLTSEQELQRLGERLFGYLFNGNDRDIFVRASTEARETDRPLRILIKLSHGSPLQKIPWEILYDGHQFPAMDPHRAVVRYFYDPKGVPSLQVDPPMRILLTSACPKSAVPLDLGAELDAIQRVYKGAGESVWCKVKRDVSLDDFKNLWQGAESKNRPFHLWHHCGHGGLTRDKFKLIFSRNGDSEYVDVGQLSKIIGTYPSLKIAILNVCHGGSFVGLAPELARINVPVVVGFPSKVADKLAYQFAVALHKFLLKSPVEFAVSQARKQVDLTEGLDLGWSKPLLFSRRRDSGTILRLPSKPRPEAGKWNSPPPEKVNPLLAKLSNALSEGGRRGS